jgi:hypothetical protein
MLIFISGFILKLATSYQNHALVISKDNGKTKRIFANSALDVQL